MNAPAILDMIRKAGAVATLIPAAGRLRGVTQTHAFGFGTPITAGQTTRAEGTPDFLEYSWRPTEGGGVEPVPFARPDPSWASGLSMADASARVREAFGGRLPNLEGAPVTLTRTAPSGAAFGAGTNALSGLLPWVIVCAVLLAVVNS